MKAESGPCESGQGRGRHRHLRVQRGHAPAADGPLHAAAHELNRGWSRTPGRVPVQWSIA